MIISGCHLFKNFLCIFFNQWNVKLCITQFNVQCMHVCHDNYCLILIVNSIYVKGVCIMWDERYIMQRSWDLFRLPEEIQ